MKKLILTFIAICGCLLLFGCTVFEEEECIPTALIMANDLTASFTVSTAVNDLRDYRL